MQSFVGTDASEKGDCILGPLGGICLSMPFEIDAQTNHMNVFTGNVEILGHEVGVVNAGSDEAVALFRLAPQFIVAARLVRLRKGLDERVFTRERTDNRRAGLLFDFRRHPGEH